MADCYDHSTDELGWFELLWARAHDGAISHHGDSSAIQSPDRCTAWVAVDTDAGTSGNADAQQRSSQ
jgi:hypothetical protein